MGYKKQLTIKQRETKLIELIKDANELGFNKKLTQGFKDQLKQIQAELEADKIKNKSYSLKRVSNSKPLRALNKPLTIA